MKPVSPEGLAMRQKIMHDATSAQGFCAADIPKPQRRGVQFICTAMVERGELFQVRFTPRRIRYFASQAAADAQPASQCPPPRKQALRRPQSLNPAQRAVRELILRQAATLEGFGCAQAAHLDAPSNVRRAARMLKMHGLLFVSLKPGGKARYFATEPAALAHDAIKPPARTKPRPAKPAAPRPVRRATPIPAQQRQTRPVKPQAPGAPGKDAVTVWPEHYRKTVQVMPPPRNQVVTISFVHGGMGVMR